MGGVVWSLGASWWMDDAILGCVEGEEDLLRWRRAGGGWCEVIQGVGVEMAVLCQKRP
jgi:hypothetical protein